MRWVFLLLATLLCLSSVRLSAQPAVLSVGVLFSQTGTMAQSELPLINATLDAIEDVNSRGGIYLAGERALKLQPIVLDGASDPQVFARQAQSLMDQGVRLVFGCWTSDSRKAVASVLEPRGALLFYPVQYEGLETSPAVIYTGLTANQQLFPALDWLLAAGRKKIFLVGSDYSFPRKTHALARRYLASRGGKVAGEAYRPLGDRDFTEVVGQIRRSGADAVLDTINGDSQDAFFSAYSQAGCKPEQLPVMCLSMAEVEVRAMKAPPLGQYAAWGYFSSLNYPANRHFRKRWGDKLALDDPVETAYWQVRALARAVTRANSTAPGIVREALRGLILDTPGGLVRIDPENFHTWRVVRIGKVREDGNFDVVWSSETPLAPQPNPYPR